MTQRIDIATAPGAFRALAGLESYVRKGGRLEESLYHLVKVRASQMNGCAYCVDMHTKDARVDAETEQRLYATVVWRETPFFTHRERAALAWTESLTDLGRNDVDDVLFEEMRRHFSEEELVDLTMLVITINSWNRVAKPFRAPVGSYEPARSPAVRAG